MMTGMVERVSQQVQGDDRVHDRRLDPAPQAIGLLTLDDPGLGPSARAALRRIRRGGNHPDGSTVQHPVQGAEETGRAVHGVGGVPALESSSRVNGSGTTGRCDITTVRATTVWRAQHAKS